MNREEILQKISTTMAEMFELDPAKIVPEARLVEDLDLDSIDAIDLAVKMQEMLQTRVDETKLRQMRTIDDVVSLIAAMMRASEGAA